MIFLPSTNQQNIADDNHIIWVCDVPLNINLFCGVYCNALFLLFIYFIKISVFLYILF